MLGTQEWMWDLDWSRVHDRLLIVVDDQQRRPHDLDDSTGRGAQAKGAYRRDGDSRPLGTRG